MVHQYQLNGYNIVLDTCSGSVHVVDEVAYDVIAMYPEHTADEIVSAMMAKYGDREDVTEEDLRQCIDDVTNLKEAGKLWTRIPMRIWLSTLKTATPWSRPCACMCTHLQPELLLLLCFAGPLSGRPCPDELRGGQACHGLPDRELRHPPQPRGGLLWRRTADEL